LTEQAILYYMGHSRRDRKVYIFVLLVFKNTKCHYELFKDW